MNIGKLITVVLGQSDDIHSTYQLMWVWWMYWGGGDRIHLSLGGLFSPEDKVRIVTLYHVPYHVKYVIAHDFNLQQYILSIRRTNVPVLCKCTLIDAQCMESSRAQLRLLFS